MSKVERALRAQKQKFWQELTTCPRSVVEQIRGSLRQKFKNCGPFLVIGNGPVTRSSREKVARLQRQEHAVVVTINDHRAQSAFKRIRPDIVAVNEYTRRRCRVLRLAAADRASVFVLVRDPRSRWREKLWQPLAPLHCARVRDHVLKRAASRFRNKRVRDARHFALALANAPEVSGGFRWQGPRAWGSAAGQDVRRPGYGTQGTSGCSRVRPRLLQLGRATGHPSAAAGARDCMPALPAEGSRWRLRLRWQRAVLVQAL